MTTTFIHHSSFKMGLMALGAILGSSLYFCLPDEPSLKVLFGILGISFLLCVIGFYLNRFFYPLLFLLCTSFFLTLTAYKVQHLETVFLPPDKSDTRYWVTGEIEEIEKGDKRARVTIKDPVVYGLEASETPSKIRISGFVTVLDDFKVGMWISAQVKLMSIAPLAYEGGFDFRRYSYLHGLGATGYVMGEVYRTSHPKRDDKITFSYYIERLRQAIHARIMSFGYEWSALSSSLLTGVRDKIPKDVIENFRASGLAHVLAISGLHIGLVGAMVFFLLRRLLLRSEKLTLKISTKKVTAVVALMVSLFYMLLAGATLPTIRATVMLAFVFIAILVGRFRLSLRSLFLTAFLILLLWPEDVISPSFQMSFAATFVLILYARKEEDKLSDNFKWMQGMNYLKGVWITSLMASVATIPIAAWHFSSFSISGVVANLLAIPLMAFWILPAGLLSLLLMPFGLEKLSLWVMAKGVDVLSKWAEFIAVHVWGSFSFVDASIWWVISGACIWGGYYLLHRKWKHSFMVVTVASFLSFGLLSFKTAPDIYALNSGHIVLARVQDASSLHTNPYMLLRGGGEYNEKRLIRYFAEDKGLTVLPKESGQNIDCDTLGCVYHLKNEVVLAMNTGQVPYEEDCMQADLVFMDSFEKESVALENCQVAHVPLSAEFYFDKSSNVKINYFMPKVRAWMLDAHI